MDEERIYGKKEPEVMSISELRAARQRTPAAPKKQPPKKGDALSKLLILQCVIAAVAVAAALIMKSVSPHGFQQLKGAYGNAMRRDMTAEEVWSSLSEQAGYVFGNVKEESTESAEAKESASSPQSTQKTRATTKLESISRETGETLATGAILPSGGADMDGEEAAKGTSFGNYEINETPAIPVNTKRISSGFGYRTNPVSGNYGFHTGIDLPIAKGTPIAAAFFGVVEEVGEDDKWGKYVLLRHSDTLQTYYCHCSEVGVKEGTVVRKGETLGKVGSTGWSTGPHLHFEVRIDEVRVDPSLLLFGKRS